MNAHAKPTIRGMLLTGCILAMLLLAEYGFSSTVTVVFDPVEEPGVIGYRIYYGNVSRGYTDSMDIGAQNIFTLTGLRPGLTYYLAVTSYDANDNESVYSQEISFNVDFIPLNDAGSDREGPKGPPYEPGASSDKRSVGFVPFDGAGSDREDPKPPDEPPGMKNFRIVGQGSDMEDPKGPDEPDASNDKSRGLCFYEILMSGDQPDKKRK